jgi:hypothetical protein
VPEEVGLARKSGVDGALADARGVATSRTVVATYPRSVNNSDAAARMRAQVWAAASASRGRGKTGGPVAGRLF